MRDILWPLFALGVALIAVVVAITSGPLALGVAIATLIVAMAVVYQYTYVGKPREKELPLEDFSWWADIGEPLFRLKSASSVDRAAACQLVASDLKILHKNASLLHGRLSLLSGRREFEDFPGFLLTETQQASGALHELIETCEREVELKPEIHRTLERIASRLDRVANKLYEFERGRSEVVKTYVDPLRRASEKLSRDLRKAASNLFQFVKCMGEGQ